jgi:hypothetical protein
MSLRWHLDENATLAFGLETLYSVPEGYHHVEAAFRAEVSLQFVGEIELSRAR